MGLIPAGAYKNRGYSIDQVDCGTVAEHYVDLLYDPQTSGGLLVSVSPEQAEEMIKDFAEKGMDTKIINNWKGNWKRVKKLIHLEVKEE